MEHLTGDLEKTSSPEVRDPSPTDDPGVHKVVILAIRRQLQRFNSTRAAARRPWKWGDPHAQPELTIDKKGASTSLGGRVKVRTG
jgi:hypothetical protein